MNYLLKIMMVAVALVTAIPSFAVTDKEMEQARAIAAKHYLRYANNGSDYLDQLNPSSVGELSKSLKPKEQENIKSFNAVAVPKDYASWDKSKLVDYWSNTFFKSPGLKEDGKKCLSILAKNLNKMTVSAPSESSKPAEPLVAETKPAETSQEPQQAPAAEPVAPVASEEQSVESEPVMDEASVVAQAEADAGLVDEQPRKSSNTGWYIGILVVLVGVVIWLVMYASKSMKETGATLADRKAGENEIREAKRAAKEEQNKLREQYASSLTSKNDEIKQLKAKCVDLEGMLEAARREADSTRRELDAAKHEIASLRQRVKQGIANSPAAQPESGAQSKSRPVQTPSDTQEPAPKSQSAARPGGLPPVCLLYQYPSPRAS